MNLNRMPKSNSSLPKRFVDVEVFSSTEKVTVSPMNSVTVTTLLREFGITESTPFDSSSTVKLRKLSR